MRGLMEADVLLAVFLFLSAYTVMLIMLQPVSLVSKKSPDPLLGSALYLSDSLVRTPGTPRNWVSLAEVSSLGFALYNRSALHNILDESKLAAMNGTDCSALYPKVDVPLDFRISVAAGGAEYACINPFPGGAVVERLAYVYGGGGYRPAVLRLYVKSVRL